MKITQKFTTKVGRFAKRIRTLVGSDVAPRDRHATALLSGQRRPGWDGSPDGRHEGRRAMGVSRENGERRCFVKTFKEEVAGDAALAHELRARELFGGRPWVAPILEADLRSIVLPYYPHARRLDQVARRLSKAERREVARQAMEILFEIHDAGFAHRDFHARNLFWIDGQLLVIDFEVFAEYPRGQRPAFPLSYDVAGGGMDSPYHTDRMCYGKDCPEALQTVLRVPLTDALDFLKARLLQDLRDVSLTFQANGRRHECQSRLTYNSFDLPYLGVPEKVAQRRSSRRFSNFRVRGDSLSGKRLLDLGSNIGGMTFHAQQYGPAFSLGVEYDAAKVEVARQVAAFNGLETVRFMQADVDALTPESLGGAFDVVFCLAIVEHVKDRARLYRFLGEVTGQVLYFEGNGQTDPDEVVGHLSQSGFSQVEFLGPSDDDARRANNCRPLFVARK